MIDPIGIILHLDQYMNSLVQGYGIWIYAILFAIIFLETGLVVTPFLPGDSLLFVAGALAAVGILNIWWLGVLFIAAAIIGDTVNYWIGHHFNKKILEKGKIRFVKKKHLDEAYSFYEKHGGKTIIIARFFAIVRTFAPFVAGITRMEYKKFLSYNVVGGVLWVAGFLTAGYLFGNIPGVRENLGLVTIGIIVVTVLIGFLTVMRKKSTK